MIKFCSWRHGRNCDIITFISKYRYFKEAWVAIFADIIKIITIFIKTISKDSRKVKRIRNYWYNKFWNNKICGFLVKKCWCQQNSEDLSRDSYFLDLLLVRYNCAKFHQCRICVTDFRDGGLFGLPHTWEAPKMPILNRVKDSQNFVMPSLLLYTAWIIFHAFNWRCCNIKQLDELCLLTFILDEFSE